MLKDYLYINARLGNAQLMDAKMLEENAGILYIVATPIGNLDDISHRALRILEEVDVILCEDTRHTRKLLSHFAISNTTKPLHDHNEKQQAAYIVEKLKQGKQLALVSDAGTPLISDPGYSVVNECRQAGMKVVSVPGACAAIAALSIAGLPTDRFLFEGFLPAKEVAKNQAMEKLLDETRTTVFYESPRRVLDTLNTIASVLGDERKVVIAREITKTFESVYQGTVAEVIEIVNSDANHQRGEFVVMVAGAIKAEGSIPAEVISTLKLLMSELPLKKAAALTSSIYGIKKNQLYQAGLDLND